MGDRHSYMSPARQITGPSPEGHSGIKSDQYCLAYEAHKNLVEPVQPNVAQCTKPTIHLFASSVVDCCRLYIFSPSTSWCTLALLLYYNVGGFIAAYTSWFSLQFFLFFFLFYFSFLFSLLLAFFVFFPCFDLASFVFFLLILLFHFQLLLW